MIDRDMDKTPTYLTMIFPLPGITPVAQSLSHMISGESHCSNTAGVSTTRGQVPKHNYRLN